MVLESNSYVIPKASKMLDKQALHLTLHIYIYTVHTHTHTPLHIHMHILAHEADGISLSPLSLCLFLSPSLHAVIRFSTLYSAIYDSDHYWCQRWMLDQREAVVQVLDFQPLHAQRCCRTSHAWQHRLPAFALPFEPAAAWRKSLRI